MEEQADRLAYTRSQSQYFFKHCPGGILNPCFVSSPNMCALDDKYRCWSEERRGGEGRGKKEIHFTERSHPPSSPLSLGRIRVGNNGSGEKSARAERSALKDYLKWRGENWSADLWRRCMDDRGAVSTKIIRCQLWKSWFRCMLKKCCQ